MVDEGAESSRIGVLWSFKGKPAVFKNAKKYMHREK